MNLHFYQYNKTTKAYFYTKAIYRGQDTVATNYNYSMKYDSVVDLGNGKYGIYAYNVGELDLHAKIQVRRSNFEIEGNLDEVEEFGRVETTVGRILFNQCFPQDIGIVDRSKPENKFAYEVK